MKEENDIVATVVRIARKICPMEDAIADLLDDELRSALEGMPGVHKISRDKIRKRNAEIIAAVGSAPGEGSMTVSEAARHFSVSRAHIYRIIESSGLNS